MQVKRDGTRLCMQCLLEATVRIRSLALLVELPGQELPVELARSPEEAFLQSVAR